MAAWSQINFETFLKLSLLEKYALRSRSSDSYRSRRKILVLKLDTV